MYRRGINAESFVFFKDLFNLKTLIENINVKVYMHGISYHLIKIKC